MKHIFEGEGKLTAKGVYEASVYVAMGLGAFAIWSLSSMVIAETLVEKWYQPDYIVRKVDYTEGRFSDKFNECVENIESDNFNLYRIHMDRCWTEETRRRGW